MLPEALPGGPAGPGAFRKAAITVGAWAVLLLALHTSAGHNYLLFHSLIELFSVVVSCAIFAVAWAARRLLERHYLLFLGIAYVSVGLVDLVHTLAFRGMGVFPWAADANLPTQLWIAARALQAVALVAAPCFISRRLDVRWALGGCGAAAAVLLVAIFSGNFPACFVPGRGLTAFKRGSEYAIVLTLIGAAMRLWRRRRDFDPGVLQLVLASIGTTVVSELAFTLYRDVTALTNEIGHDLKLLAFFLLYYALVETGLTRPFQILFRELKQKEAALTAARDELDLRVQERTKELSVANAHLGAEIAGREHAEAEDARLTDELRRVMDALRVRTVQLETIGEVNVEITRELDLATLLDLITRRAAELTRAPLCTTLLWHEADQRFVPRAWHGVGDWIQELQFPAGEGLIGKLAQTRQGLLVNDYAHWPDAHPALVQRAGVTAALAQPLLFRDRLIGAIVLNHCEAHRRFSEANQDMVALLAAQAAIAIENARLFEQVACAKEEWEATFDAMPDLVAIVDSQYRLSRVNRAMARRLDRSPAQLVGEHCYTVLESGNRPCAACLHEDVLSGARSVTREVAHPRLGGAFLVTGSPLSNGRSVHVFRDLTEIRRLEEAARQRQRFEDLSRAKSAFIATMSHELRTPLNAILGFSDLLRDPETGPLTEQQAQFLTHVSSSGKHLLHLINDILDLSKVEAGKIVLQPECLKLTGVLEDVLAIVRGLANKKGQSVRSDVAADLPPLYADPVRLKQILFNLLSNAVKFTPEHGIIFVTGKLVSCPGPDRAGRDPASGQRGCPPGAAQRFLQVQVTDTGAGIKAEDLPRLFQEFAQLETTRRQHLEGTGLGLALTKRFVELHGGSIRASSDGEGLGSTFTVTLPLAPAPPCPAI